MSDDNVLLILQAVDEARAIVTAIEKDNPNAVVEYEPAMVKITCPKKLTINTETVEGVIGRDWETHELQLILITLAGHVDEDYDHFTLYWNQ